MRFFSDDLEQNNVVEFKLNGEKICFEKKRGDFWEEVSDESAKFLGYRFSVRLTSRELEDLLEDNEDKLVDYQAYED